MQLGTWPADRMTDWATDWLTVQFGTWLTDRMTDWVTDWLTLQFGTWPADRMTNWPLTECSVGYLTDWLTLQLGSWPADWMTDWATDWLTDCVVGYLTGWQSDWLRYWLNDWLNWVTYHLTDSVQATDWQTSGLTGVPKPGVNLIKFLQVYPLFESALIKLWSNELLYPIPMNFNFLFSRTDVSVSQLNQKKATHNQTK